MRSIYRIRPTIINAVLFSLAVVLLAGCAQPSADIPTASPVDPTQTLPDPPVKVTKSPDPMSTADAFLKAWQGDDYEAMYRAISSGSKGEISEEEFIERYKEFAREITLQELSYSILSTRTNPDSSMVDYDLVISSNLFDDFSHTNSMQLLLENGDWVIEWKDSLIMPELAGGNVLRLDPQIPGREAIFAADETALAERAEAVAVGIYPDFVDPESSEGLITWLSRISGLRFDQIIQLIEDAEPGEYIPIAEVLSDDSERIINALSGYGAVSIGSYTSRFYPDGGIAPHVVGYVSAIQQDEVDEFRRLGYQSYEKVGRDGIEEWGEQELSGEKGGDLYIVDQEGKIVSKMAEKPSTDGSAIYTTIDPEFQQAVQKSLEGLRGAAVVLERDTGKVLAMASSPSFNPNGFQTENINWDSWLSQIYSNPNTPLLNRASQGQYPLGSVFKIITMASALESGVFTPESEYECGYFFTEALGLDLNDWTYDWFLEDGVTQPSGLLTLPEGLIRSCNPYFWHIGFTLFNQGLENVIPEMARGFGLGSPTGIEGINEEPGNIPDQDEPVDAINMAIGQGEVLVTPLQVANFVAAIGNGGTLFKPWVIDRIEDRFGNVSFATVPEEIGQLPVSEENLEVIQEAMEGVVSSRNPRGTAYRVFNGFKIPIAGKTGTAESGLADPHAWFVAYSNMESEDNPDIAVAVIVENEGEGSEWAAPVVRRIIELYFYGSPQRLYPWESGIGITKTPSPIVTPTPEE